MERFIRQLILRLATGESAPAFASRTPTREELRGKLRKIESLGLYLHIPFCERICSYCPYNKEIFRRGLAERYRDAVIREMDFYAQFIGGTPVTSIYIGGGSPTTMLECGLDEMIERMRDRFDLRCDIHMESHPNHLSAENLAKIKDLGVRHLSLGVEALFDRHLEFLGRPYTADGVRDAIRRAVSAGFECVNVDVMFDLPGQTPGELAETGRELVGSGVDQVAAYPLFLFPYTPLGKAGSARNHTIARSLRRRKMLRVLEKVFDQAGYERTSVWAFTRRGVPRYCSVTVPTYLGLGASGGSYLEDVFYLNTFGVADYVEAVERNGTAVALSMDLTERMQRAGWLYWRIYDTAFAKSGYRDRFGEDIDRVFGRYFRFLKRVGFLDDDGERITLSDRGAFWLHAGEDILSIDSIGKVWGTMKRDAWPEEVAL